MCFRISLGGKNRWLFVVIVEPTQQLAHATIAIGKAKLLLDPRDRFGGAANISIEPSCEELQLLVAHPSVAADIIEVGERLFAATRKGFDPTSEGFGMDMEDTADGFSVLAAL